MSKDEFIAMLKKSQMLANEKQNKLHKAEKYSGRSTFENELCHSFDEFMRSVIKVFGCCPYKLEDIFPNYWMFSSNPQFQQQLLTPKCPEQSSCFCIAFPP
jgi:hypothetical protein